MDPIKIENERYLVEFEPQHGRFQRLLDKRGGVQFDSPAEETGGFRITLKPREGGPARVIDGRRQALSGSDLTPKGGRLSWKGPLKDEEGAEAALEVTLFVEFAGDGVQFRLEADNGTDLRLTEARYPMIGGLRAFGEGTGSPARLFTTHANQTEYPLDDSFEAQGFSYPGWALIMAWMDLYHPGLNRGIYIGSHDPIMRIRTFEFETYEAAGPGGRKKDAGLVLVHYPYTKPGERFVGSPLVLEFHEGDWHAGCKIYRKWFKEAFGIVDVRKDWLRMSTAAQDSMFLLPEGNVNVRFKDVPQWARDAQRFGVNALCFSGWHRGGHDNGYPYYEPDPRLGTWEELKEALAEVRKMGMRSYFFVNIYPIDNDNEWYREELYKYTGVSEPQTMGGYGWGMGTLGARMSLTTRLMYSASPGYPQFRKILVDCFRKLAEAGADGIHIDKMMTGWIEDYPDMPMSPDEAGWWGSYLVMKETLEACRPINPDFIIGAETYWDGLLPFGGVSWWGGPEVWRCTFPEWTPVMGVNMAFGYIPVNEAVCRGDQLLLGPNYWNLSMGVPQWRSLSKYVAEVNRIRETLKDTIFLGEYHATRQATVQGVDDSHFKYSVFQNQQTGKRACILVNNGDQPLKRTVVSFDGNGGGPVRVYQPYEKDQENQLPATIVIGPERFAVVEER